MTPVDRVSCDVAVVGAGPAGLAAATAAAGMGSRVLLLDAFASPGGQYNMASSAPAGVVHEGDQAREGRRLAGQATAAGVDIRTGAEVFWAERRSTGFTLHAACGDGGLVVKVAAVVAATGAMERPVPFPGWTLPGVIGAGAAQRLVKTAGIAPGRRVMLAGTGPFLLAVARTFADAGMPLASFLEVMRPTPAAAGLLIRNPERGPEAARLLSGLLRSGAGRLFGWAVVEALGADRLAAVRIAPVAADGTADLGQSRLVEGIDALCVGYGFKPVIDLTALLKAKHVHDDAAGGWVCAADPLTGATDVAGLHAAGETTGIGGAVVARLSGRLAGRHAAVVAGAGGDPHDPAAAAALARSRRFASALSALWPFPHRLAAQLAAGATICRCEDVPASAVASAVADGARTVGAAKMWTRAGMGPCQGRVCGPPLAAMIAHATGRSVAEMGFNPPHLPLRPVPIDIVEACLDG